VWEVFHKEQMTFAVPMLYILRSLVVWWLEFTSSRRSWDI